jgi:hypothetical protein
MFRLTVACLFMLSLFLVGCGADKTQPTEVKGSNMKDVKDKMKKIPDDVED